MKQLNNILILAALLLVAGCTSTVIPTQVIASHPTFDASTPAPIAAVQGVQNSGILSIETNSTGAVTGAFITQHAVDRYNGLMVSYGKAWSPPVTNNAGITYTTNGVFSIDAQHLIYFLKANTWHKENKPIIP